MMTRRGLGIQKCQSRAGDLSARPEHVCNETGRCTGKCTGQGKGSGGPRVWKKWGGRGVGVVFRYGAVELDRPVRVVNAPILESQTRNSNCWACRLPSLRKFGANLI
jgi:hypothetical protein